MFWQILIGGDSVNLNNTNGYIQLNDDILDPVSLEVTLNYQGLNAQSQILELNVEVVDRDEHWPENFDFENEILTTKVTEGSETELVRLSNPYSDVINPKFSVIGCNCKSESLTVIGQSIFSTSFLDFDNDVSVISNIQVFAQFGNGGQVFEIQPNIEVANLNDHAPFCGGMNNYLRATISESYHEESIEKIEINLEIGDLDNAPFNVSIQNVFAGNALAQSVIDQFQLVSANGEIFFQSIEGAVINLETLLLPSAAKSMESSYHALFLVQVYDSHDAALKSTCTVDLEILDVNEYRPECEINPNPLRIPEKMEASRGIAIVECQDNDVTQGPGLRFSLSEGAQYFEIDENTGIISALGELDYEQLQTIQVAIVVENGNLETTQVQTIDVINVNDEKPYFETMDDPVILQGKIL